MQGWTMDRDPLTGPPPAEIPLANAPLVRVLAQVRFPTILRIDQDSSFVMAFQDAIRSEYAFLEHERSQETLAPFGPGLQIQIGTPSVWRFADAAKDWRWRASLAPDFLSLETSDYVSRNDFLNRFENLINVTESTVHPGAATRIGLRYVDQLSGNALESINSFLNPAVLGFSQTVYAKYVRLNLGEVLLAAPDEDAALRLRYGYLPAGATMDPTTLIPLERPSWIIDIDMFDEKQRPFVGTAIAAQTRAFAERIYSVFRAIVTPDFLRYYGAKL